MGFIISRYWSKSIIRAPWGPILQYFSVTFYQRRKDLAAFPLKSFIITSNKAQFSLRAQKSNNISIRSAGSKINGQQPKSLKRGPIVFDLVGTQAHAHQIEASMQLSAKLRRSGRPITKNRPFGSSSPIRQIYLVCRPVYSALRSLAHKSALTCGFCAQGIARPRGIFDAPAISRMHYAGSRGIWGASYDQASTIVSPAGDRLAQPERSEAER